MATKRQNRLLVAEDWRKIYTAFQSADFKSYDFETIRRTMVAYLQENYPDDFNDFVESSEYIALLDLIAYVAQSLSFRLDLNARENFLETASRRNSLLRLARLINYNAARNKPALGMLKFTSVSTTEDIKDRAGQNLSGLTVRWNDAANPNYREHFVNILNGINQSNQTFGKPLESGKIGNISTEIYATRSSNTDIPMYTFSRAVSGITRKFEIVPASILQQDYIYERLPLPGGAFTYAYRSDGAGDSSNNTGFFALFKEGTLQTEDFTINDSVTNLVQPLSANNINDSDMWLWQLDDFGQPYSLWKQVPALAGNNAIYNSLEANVRNIYNAVTRANDGVDLVFGDGNFADIPMGRFRAYYRTSANERYTVQPGDMQNIQFNIGYIDKNGSGQTLTVGASLQQTLYNSAQSESSASIREKAPQVYYSQDRMITAEDYNIVPLKASQEIIKIRSVNRTASGISRAKEIVDPTGSYSNVNVVADDGIIYREETLPSFTFTFTSKNDILNTLNTKIETKLKQPYSRQFYYDKYGSKDLSLLATSWNSTTTSTNANTGYIYSSGPLVVGEYATSNLKYVKPGALIKFTSPDTRKFKNGKLVDSSTDEAEDRKWAKVATVVGDGANGGVGNLESGVGPITLADIIPDNAVVKAVIPQLATSLGATLKSELQDRITAYENFALRYDETTGTWKVITTTNVSANNTFSLGLAGDTTGTNLDQSWWFNFTNDGTTYTVTYRKLDYIFESAGQNKFYFDPQEKIYDYTSGQTKKDTIQLLKNNTLVSTGNAVGYHNVWQVVDTISEADGYQDNRKVKIGFFDSDDDGVVDNPELFEIMVEPTLSESTKWVFYEKFISSDNNIERYRPYAASNFIVTQNESSIVLPGSYTDGQLFYFYDSAENVIKKYSSTTNSLVTTTDYYARKGRSSMYFQYKHFAGNNTRIDPSVSNIVDIYLLERSYDTLFRKWLKTGGDKPRPSTSDQLRISYSNKLNPVKGLSDQIIYHPVSYKILFGTKSEEEYQATFKVVKNPESNISNAIIKTMVVDTIDQFFALNNFDFGDSFYFTELAAHIHNRLAPHLLTVVIVPNQTGQVFGSLFQIAGTSNEIFISGATVDDVAIIDAIGANQLQASGTVVTSTTTTTKTARSTSAVSGSTSTGTVSGAGY